MIAVARAAEQGLGAALIPARLANRWLESQALVQLFDHALLTKDAYYLACHSRSTDDEAFKAFRDWVLREFVHDE
jgi:LysR family glycine cleavage system transcriptional activator